MASEQSKNADLSSNAAMGVVNRSVPLAQIKDEMRKLAKVLLEKGPAVLYYAKIAFKYIDTMDWDTATEWPIGKSSQLRLNDRESIRQRAMTSFLDKKDFRPGLEPFNRAGEQT